MFWAPNLNPHIATAHLRNEDMGLRQRPAERSWKGLPEYDKDNYLIFTRKKYSLPLNVLIMPLSCLIMSNIIYSIQQYTQYKHIPKYTIHCILYNRPRPLIYFRIKKALNHAPHTNILWAKYYMYNILQYCMLYW